MKLKLILFALVLIEFFLVCLLVSPTFIDSAEDNRVWNEYYQHPTDELKSKLVSIRNKRSAMDLTIDGVILACMAVNGWGMFAIARKMRTKTSSPC